MNIENKSPTAEPVSVRGDLKLRILLNECVGAGTTYAKDEDVALEELYAHLDSLLHARYREGVQRGAARSAATYSPLVAARTVADAGGDKQSAEKAGDLSYCQSQRKMIERAIIGLRDGWATPKDAEAALAALAAVPDSPSAADAGDLSGAQTLRDALTAVDGQLVAILNGADGSVYNRLKAARNDLVRVWLPLARPTDVLAVDHAKQTDLAKRLLAMADETGGSIKAITVLKSDLTAICCEVNRYYTGMMNWKATAEAKDRSTAMGAGSLSDELIEELDTLRSEFYSYQEGDPKVPFTTIRQQIIATLEAFDAARPNASGAVDLITPNDEEQEEPDAYATPGGEKA